jgi:hypothetical protein
LRAQLVDTTVSLTGRPTYIFLHKKAASTAAYTQLVSLSQCNNGEAVRTHFMQSLYGEKSQELKVSLFPATWTYSQVRWPRCTWRMKARSNDGSQSPSLMVIVLQYHAGNHSVRPYPHSAHAEEDVCRHALQSNQNKRYCQHSAAARTGSPEPC